MTIHYLNNQIKQLYGVTEEDYIAWCLKNNKQRSYKASVAKFVENLRTGRLVRDMTTGKLVVKKPRKKQTSFRGMFK